MNRLAPPLAALAALAALACSAGASASAAPGSMQAGLAAAVHADVAASAYDPALRVDVWALGDATQVGQKSTVSGYGYPHDELAVQEPGSASFRVLPGRGGYGWQQVPFWPDGSFFWMGGLLVNGGEVYDFGQRVTPAGEVLGDYTARWSARALAYQGVAPMPGYDSWSDAVPAPGGWWLAGTRDTCAGLGCKTGDTAFVPVGDVLSPARWQVYPGSIGAGLYPGTVVSLLRWRGRWLALTKRLDRFGSAVEELSAATPAGPWALTGKTWPAPSPAGTVTYSVQLHPREGAPAGTVDVTYAVNCAGPQTAACPQYWPDFLEVSP